MASGCWEVQTLRERAIVLRCTSIAFFFCLFSTMRQQIHPICCYSSTRPRAVITQTNTTFYPEGKCSCFLRNFGIHAPENRGLKPRRRQLQPYALMTETAASSEMLVADCQIKLCCNREVTF